MENIYTNEEQVFIDNCKTQGFDNAKARWVFQYIEKNTTEEQRRNSVVVSVWQETAEKEFTVFHKAFRAKWRDIGAVTTPKREKKTEEENPDQMKIE